MNKKNYHLLLEDLIKECKQKDAAFNAAHAKFDAALNGMLQAQAALATVLQRRNSFEARYLGLFDK